MIKVFPYKRLKKRKERTSESACPDLCYSKNGAGASSFGIMGDLVKHTEPRPHPSTVGSDCTWGRLCSTGPASPFLIAYMEWSFKTQICYGSFLIKTLNISHFHSINFKVPNMSYVA